MLAGTGSWNIKFLWIQICKNPNLYLTRMHIWGYKLHSINLYKTSRNARKWEECNFKGMRVTWYVWNHTNVQAHAGTRTQSYHRILTLQITGFETQIFGFEIFLCLLTGCVILDKTATGSFSVLIFLYLHTDFSNASQSYFEDHGVNAYSGIL